MIGSVLVRLLMLRLVRGLYWLDIPVRNVLIYGAGTTGMQLALALRPDIGTRVIGFVDDNKVLQSVSVAGLPVFPVSAVAAVAQYNNVKRILLAMPSVSRPKLARIARRLGDLGLEVHSVPSFAQLVGEERLVKLAGESAARRILEPQGSGRHTDGRARPLCRKMRSGIGSLGRGGRHRVGTVPKVCSSGPSSKAGAAW